MADGMRASFLAAPLPPYHLNRWRNCRPSGGFSLSLWGARRWIWTVEVEAKKEWRSHSVAKLVRHQLVLSRAIKLASSEKLACGCTGWVDVDMGDAQHVLDYLPMRADVADSPPPCPLQCVVFLSIDYILLQVAVCYVSKAWMLDCYIKIQLGRHLIQAKLQGVLRCLP